MVLKHLAAQGEAVGGRNGQSAVLGPHDLHEIHLPPVAAGVRAGALGFMAAYNDIDSVPCCANPWLLEDYLRDQLGFDGIVMADGLAVDRLEDMAGSIPAAGRAALLAGVDVSLWDEGFARLEEYVDDEQVEAAVDTALRRVLELKAMFGLLPEDGADTAAIAMPDADAIAQATADGREQAKRMAREAITLINDGRSAVTLDSIRGVLTDAQAGPVIVAGPFADDFGCFLGDYTALCPPMSSQASTGNWWHALGKTGFAWRPSRAMCRPIGGRVRQPWYSYAAAPANAAMTVNSTTMVRQRP